MEWKEPLFRILEGYEDLLRVTSDFPNIGKLPALGKISEKEIGRIEPQPRAAAAAVVVVVVCVAVAARPGAVTSEELLRAKLLDVYSPKEREALHKAIKVVQKDPSLIKATLGIEELQLGKDFMGRLATVERAIA